VQKRKLIIGPHSGEKLSTSHRYWFLLLKKKHSRSDSKSVVRVSAPQLNFKLHTPTNYARIDWRGGRSLETLIKPLNP